MARVVKVVGAAVVLKTVDGREGYFYRGTVIPTDGFEESALEHTQAQGLIEIADEEEVDVLVAVDPNGTPVVVTGTPTEPGALEGAQAAIVPAGTEGVEVPEGAPEKSWTHAQIDAWAARQTPPVALEADASKDVKLEAIAKLQAAPKS